MLAAPPERRSIWTTRQKVVRLAWGTVGRLLWRLLPGARPALLRRFGALVEAPARHGTLLGSTEWMCTRQVLGQVRAAVRVGVAIRIARVHRIETERVLPCVRHAIAVVIRIR